MNSCQLDPDAMMLWCDDSNVTEIPHPETIHGYSPTGYAEAIFMNNSCLQRINTGRNKYKTCSSNIFEAFISKTKVGIIDILYACVQERAVDKSELFVVWCPV